MKTSELFTTLNEMHAKRFESIKAIIGLKIQTASLEANDIPKRIENQEKIIDLEAQIAQIDNRLSSLAAFSADQLYPAKGKSDNE